MCRCISFKIYFNSVTNETAGLTVKDVSEAANVVDK